MIYIDLDNTLIHATWGGNPNKNRVKIDLGGKEVYWSMLRPKSQEFVHICRTIAPTFLMTFAAKDYALAHNDTFSLGFTESEILARTDFSHTQAGMFVDRTYPLSTAHCPTGLLIDDNPPSDEQAKVKMAFLGIPPSRYIQSRNYRGGKHPPDFAKELAALRALLSLEKPRPPSP